MDEQAKLRNELEEEILIHILRNPYYDVTSVRIASAHHPQGFDLGFEFDLLTPPGQKTQYKTLNDFLNNNYLDVLVIPAKLGASFFRGLRRSQEKTYRIKRTLQFESVNKSILSKCFLDDKYQFPTEVASPISPTGRQTLYPVTHTWDVYRDSSIRVLPSPLHPLQEIIDIEDTKVWTALQGIADPIPVIESQSVNEVLEQMKKEKQEQELLTPAQIKESHEYLTQQRVVFDEGTESTTAQMWTVVEDLSESAVPSFIEYKEKVLSTALGISLSDISLSDISLSEKEPEVKP